MGKRAISGFGWLPSPPPLSFTDHIWSGSEVGGIGFEVSNCIRDRLDERGARSWLVQVRGGAAAMACSRFSDESCPVMTTAGTRPPMVVSTRNLVIENDAIELQRWELDQELRARVEGHHVQACRTQQPLKGWAHGLFIIDDGN